MKNRNIVITGGSRGLGLAIVKALLENDYGVISISRHPSNSLNQLITLYPDRLESIIADISESEKLVDIYKFITNKYCVYGLINNAGYVKDSLLVVSTPVEINRMIQVNLTSPILLSRLFSKHLIINRQGRIINISSIVSSKAYKGLVTYAATKAGLVAFSKGLALEIGNRNITVNCISPGFIPTRMNEHLSGDNFERIVKKIPLMRFPSPEDIANSIIFLLSDNAGNITGTNFVIDCGQSL